ncbi:hypothetical protein M5K25_001069 [Dendrobium thyrsiflorum]|uniref:Uncharacterized protein n=1 Tax=Dendrobium thyrsiflorum TaxID=117978 RepID=A0ABD0WB32_DENTH
MSSSVFVAGNSNSIALPAILQTFAGIESSFQQITRTFLPTSSANLISAASDVPIQPSIHGLPSSNRHPQEGFKKAT